EPGVGCDQADRARGGDGSLAADPAPAPVGRDGPARLGPAAGDRGRALGRPQLADHPAWVDGLTFASGRMTAEVGPAPFLNFQSQYESTYGVDRVGVKNSAGQPVFQPPEFAMYSSDFVHVLIAAITKAGSVEPEKILRALNEVTTQGANGDERGFNE